MESGRPKGKSETDRHSSYLGLTSENLSAQLHEKGPVCRQGLAEIGQKTSYEQIRALSALDVVGILDAAIGQLYPTMMLLVELKMLAL